MKITRRQLRKLIRESVDENEDAMMIAKLNAWIDTLSSNKVQKSYGSIAWEESGTEEDWAQLYEMVELLYGDQIPPTLKLWDAANAWQGEILNNPEFMTQEQARTLHLRDPSYFPVDEDNNPIDEPTLPSWSNSTYLYDQKVDFKRQLSPVEV